MGTVCKLLLFFLLSAAPLFGQSFNDQGTPCGKKKYKTAEAPYRDYVIRTYRDAEMNGCLQIRQQGKLVFSLMSANFKIGTNFLGKQNIPIGVDITGAGVPNATVIESTGGAHCCLVFHVFELGEHFREVAKIQAEHSDGAQFLDLNHDGQYEFRGNDWAFAYWGTSFAGSPAPTIVLKYENDFITMSAPRPE